MQVLLRAAAFLLLLTVSPALCPAQKHQHHHHKNHSPAGQQLRFTLILARHGIRPPLAPAADLNAFSSQPWPAWDVPPGHLTTHGAQAIALMGVYLRQEAASTGLFPAQGCISPAEIYLYSDTDQRNIASARATFSAFNPHCPALPVFTYVPGLQALPAYHDPFFLPLNGTFRPPPARLALERMRAALPVNPDAALSASDTPSNKREINELAHILAPDPAHPPARPILSETPAVLANPLGDPIVITRGPLPSASYLIEDLALEYADNKPLTDVGWGRADAAAIHRLLPLHIAAFSYAHRTRFFARAESSNALAHILDTLDQASLEHLAHGKSVRGALGPPGTRLVYISAHDTNLAGVAALLGLHWVTGGLADDIPPDSMLLFELWERPGDRDYTLRIRFRAQTLDQLRNLTPLTADHVPDQVDLIPTGCHKPDACPYTTFRHVAESTLNRRFVKPDLLATHIAP